MNTTNETAVQFPTDKPKLQLSGEDGNVFMIMGLAARAARKAKWTAEQVQALQDHLRSSEDYDEVLQRCMTLFDVT